MSEAGWKRLLEGWPWFEGEGRYPLAAYSEFMPPPRLVRRPYGDADALYLADDDPWGWPVTEYEEALTLRPGLGRLADNVVGKLTALGRGEPDHGVPEALLADNPCWPKQLARGARKLKHERYVLLLPLALSRTDDDMGRIGWTLFGASEQGPARAFWRSFFTAPDREAPPEQGPAFVRRLLGVAYGEPDERLGNLLDAGFRILPQKEEDAVWADGPLPSWAEPYLWDGSGSLRGVKYLLTFRPFARLPARVRRAYLEGALHLLPCPGGLLFWGVPGYHRLQRELPLALQIPLLQLAERHEGPGGVRVPQSGWFGEPPPGGGHGRLRDTYKRTHRYARIHRHESGLTEAREEHLAHVLFGSDSKDVGLYHKPQARNAQLWTHDYRLLLDGPAATPADLDRAGEALERGGWFGYRFQFPAMRVGLYELYWHRPLVAYACPHSGRPSALPDAPAGYLTAYRAEGPDLANPVELWPRLLRRERHRAAIELFKDAEEEHPHQTLQNVHKLLHTRGLMPGPLPPGLARQVLNLPKGHTLEGWLRSLPGLAADADRGRWLANELRDVLGPEPAPPRQRRPPRSLTFAQTARRPFEVAYWNTIAFLSAGAYRNKNNADPVLDPPTQAALAQGGHDRRELNALAAHLLTCHLQAIADSGLEGRAWAGELPFVWRTNFAYPWMGGWADNQKGSAHERDLIVVIPGRDRKRAVIMADHYDTAYMSDRYEKEQGGDGARLAAPGADDNASATAALLLAAPIFLALSRAGKLACDVWLVHLTGEEFPAESLGARHLVQCLVEGTLKAQLPDGRWRHLSGVRVQGAYVLDMIAHNGNQDRDVFQIAPGSGSASLWLAYQAHLAAEAWNASVPFWNGRTSRRGLGRGRRSRSRKPPPTAAHLALHGEVRPPYDPRSTLYNSDGRIFADAGVPAVLLMESYDISRSGYHDSEDTLANINLDYGAALAAVAIEAVARAATEAPP